MRKRKGKENGYPLPEKNGTEETISEGGNDITEKEKEDLLYQDLCARIPYGPKCECEFAKPAKNGYSGCVETLTAFLVGRI